MTASTPILILPATKAFDDNVKGADIRSWYQCRHMSDLHRANIVIIVGPTHFCCIKNRWGMTCTRDRIPNNMLKSYLLQYSKHLTKESLIDALTEQHRDRWSESWTYVDDILSAFERR